MTMMRPVPLSPSAGHIPGIAVCKPPWEWSRDEVSDWLFHCEREYALDKIDLKRFSMNGKALYILTKQDFLDRVPSIGDVLFNHLHLIHDEAQRSILFAQQSSCIQKPYDPYSLSMNAQDDKAHESRVPFHSRLTNGNMTAPLPMKASSFHHNDGPQSPTSPSLITTSYTLLTNNCGNHHTSHVEDEEAPQNLVMYERKLVNTHEVHGPHASSSPTSSTDSVLLLSHGNKETHPYERNGLARQTNYDESAIDDTNGVMQMVSPAHPDCRNGRNKTNKGEGRLLWDFLSNLLKNDLAPKCISWEDEENDIFRIHDATALAQLWGKQKNRSNMTYEKMSRALRYYYKMNIIEKVKGKRLTYRFVKKPDEIRRGRGAALRCSRVTSLEAADCAVARASIHVTESECSDMENMTCKTETELDQQSYSVESGPGVNHLHNSRGTHLENGYDVFNGMHVKPDLDRT